MATQTSRVLFCGNVRFLPPNILLAPLSGASSAITIPPFSSFAEPRRQDSDFVKFLVGLQPTVGPAPHIEAINNAALIFDTRFGGLGRLEARGNKVVVDDEDFDSSEDIHDEDMPDHADFPDDDDEDADWNNDDDGDDDKF